jgi:hypothetical protein
MVVLVVGTHMEEAWSLIMQWQWRPGYVDGNAGGVRIRFEGAAVSEVAKEQTIVVSWRLAQRITEKRSQRLVDPQRSYRAMNSAETRLALDPSRATSSHEGA